MELIEEICEGISDGQSLMGVLRDNDHLPDRETIRKWHMGKKDLHVEWQIRYAIALEERADSIADEMIELADKSRPEDAQKTKIQLDTRKWVTSNLLPRKYGTNSSVALTGAGGGPIEITAGADLSLYTTEELEDMAKIQRGARERRERGIPARAAGDAGALGNRDGAPLLEAGGEAEPEGTEG